MTTPILTISWDDGHPRDLRIAELLVKYGLAATFYVPCRNSEGHPTMSRQEIRTLSEAFEIGGHTLDHIDLRGRPVAEVKRQIEVGKDELEQTLGRTTQGFCYPRGGVTATVKKAVRAAGYSYARTTENFCLQPGDDRFLLPTTLQLFPHKRSIYLSNYISRMRWSARLPAFARSVLEETVTERVRRLHAYWLEYGGYLHLWGHSWEIEDHNLWRDLEVVLAILSQNAKASVSNAKASSLAFATAQQYAPTSDPSG